MMNETRRKQYVKVNADHEIDGSVQPQKIIFQNGQIFMIDNVQESTKVPSLSKFPTTNRYTVVVRGKEAFLYEDGGRWYVKMKT